MAATHAASERSRCVRDWSGPRPRVDDSEDKCASRLSGEGDDSDGSEADPLADMAAGCSTADAATAAVATGVICSTCARCGGGAVLMVDRPIGFRVV